MQPQASAATHLGYRDNLRSEGIELLLMLLQAQLLLLQLLLLQLLLLLFAVAARSEEAQVPESLLLRCGHNGLR